MATIGPPSFPSSRPSLVAPGVSPRRLRPHPLGRWKLAAAVAAVLVAAAMLTLFLVPRAGRPRPVPQSGEPGPPPLLEVELPSPVVAGGAVTLETSLGRVVWARVPAPFGFVASSPDGLFNVQADARGLRVRSYDSGSASWFDVAPIEGRDRWAGLGRIVSDRDLYFFSIDAGCADLALGDGGLAPSPGAERCLALERSDDGGLTFQRSALDMADAFVPRSAKVTSSGSVWLLDAIGTGNGDHRYWSSTDGRTWRSVEPPWSTDARASAANVGSIIPVDAGLVAYAPDGSGAWRSDDGATWAPVTDLSGLPTDSGDIMVARAAENLLAVAGGTIYRSSDGADWDVIGVLSDRVASDSIVSAFGSGAVIASADNAGCVARDTASIRVTTDGSRWFEVLDAVIRSEMDTSRSADSGDDQLCIQIATNTIIVETSADTWIAEVEEPSS